MPKRTLDFYTSALNTATILSFEKQICIGKKIPDVKTVPAYERSLDSAIRELFLQSPTAEELILEILRDAKQHDRWPKQYKSTVYKKITLGKVNVIQARFYLEKEIKIKFRIDGMSVKVFYDRAEKLLLQDPFKDEYNNEVPKELMYFKELLMKIEEIRQNTNPST